MSQDETIAAVLKTLPDALAFDDGSPVRTPADWRRRRGELLATFTREMYGRMPPALPWTPFEVIESSDTALGGRVRRRQVALHLSDAADAPRAELLIYLPPGDGPVPVLLGLNTWGSQTVTVDTAVRITARPVFARAKDDIARRGGVVDARATDKSRGYDAAHWPIETILARGIGVATIYRGEFDADTPDHPEWGIRAADPALANGDDNFSTIGAWAWGLSRCVDYLAQDAEIDARRIGVWGWSRLGKAALWAGATDERIGLVISAESGSGGAKVFHHDVGENVKRLTEIFPHWFCRNFRNYVGRETTMPFDQHEVLALIAPRPLYVSGSAGALPFDAIGEYLGPRAADRVYRLLGTDGLPDAPYPPEGQALHGRIGYHRRSGGHDVTAFDWQQFLTFCDKHWKK